MDDEESNPTDGVEHDSDDENGGVEFEGEQESGDD